VHGDAPPCTVPAPAVPPQAAQDLAELALAAAGGDRAAARQALQAALRALEDDGRGC
jgi:hypothetical protein